MLLQEKLHKEKLITKGIVWDVPMWCIPSQSQLIVCNFILKVKLKLQRIVVSWYRKLGGGAA